MPFQVAALEAESRRASQAIGEQAAAEAHALRLEQQQKASGQQGGMQFDHIYFQLRIARAYGGVPLRSLDFENVRLLVSMSYF